MGSGNRTVNLNGERSTRRARKADPRGSSILGEEVKVIAEEAKERSRVAKDRAEAASARLKKLKRATSDEA
jgi:hypothetical protein